MSKKIRSQKKKLRDDEEESEEEEEDFSKSRKITKEKITRPFPFSYFSGEYILRPMIAGAAVAFGLSIGKIQNIFFIIYPIICYFLQNDNFIFYMKFSLIYLTKLIYKRLYSL